MADFSLKQKKGKDGLVLKVSGSLTIQHAAAMREAILEAFAKAESVTVDLESLEKIDLTGLQLLCAAHRTSIGQRKQLTVLGVTSDQVIDAAQLAGFFRHVGCSLDVERTCIWIGGA